RRRWSSRALPGAMYAWRPWRRARAAAGAKVRSSTAIHSTRNRVREEGCEPPTTRLRTAALYPLSYTGRRSDASTGGVAKREEGGGRRTLGEVLLSGNGDLA